MQLPSTAAAPPTESRATLTAPSKTIIKQLNSIRMTPPPSTFAALQMACGANPTAPFKTSHVDALYSRGLTYSNKGLWDRAIQDFDLAITLNPNYSDALNNRGLAYIGKGQYDRAIQNFDQVLKLDPKDADAIRNRAMAIARKNN